MNPARLVLTARDEKEGKEALTQETGYTNAELWIIHLANFSSVIAFANRAERELERLDILVENAGMATWEYEQVEGWEGILHTNNLGPGLLAIHMIPKLLETACKHSVIPRLVIVDVIAGPSILAKLSDNDYCTKEVMDHRYFDSKLLSILFARSLQLHVLSSPAITVNSVNPRFCHSGLRTTIPAEELIYGAIGSLDDEEKLHGKFIQMSEIVEESNFVISEDGKIVQDKVWGEMLNILGKIDPKVMDVAKTYLK
ncbi:hypothetical protein IW262DRAFT_1530247 [Armillaria fumosa]|nr:hypothetical protein IW262DRAFT_1530247 [Armillaria fumosa]